MFLLVSFTVSFGQSLEGAWSGTATDSRPTSGTFPVSMTLDSSGNGRIDYKSYGCGGTLTLLSQSDNTYRYRESLTYGIKECIDGGEVTVVPSGDSLQWTWRGSGVTATATLSGHRVEKAPTGCISPGQTRTTDGFVYWNFKNSCNADRMVTVCAEYANGNNNILSTNVPAKGSADINLGASSLPMAKLTWKEGGGIRCPSR